MWLCKEQIPVCYTALNKEHKLFEQKEAVTFCQTTDGMFHFESMLSVLINNIRVQENPPFYEKAWL